MRHQRFWDNFELPVYWSSGECSCVAGEFAWYVLFWNLLALGWSLVSVKEWRHLMSSYCSIFPEFKSSLMFSGFGFKPPASGFQFYFTVASRLLHLYSTDDKTSRFKMKSFSTLRDTQRVTLWARQLAPGLEGKQQQPLFDTWTSWVSVALSAKPVWWRFTQNI